MYPLHIIQTAKHIIAAEESKSMKKDLKKNRKGKRDGKKEG